MYEVVTPKASDSNASSVALVVISACVAAAVAVLICAKKRKEASLAAFEERWLGTPPESIVIDVHEPVEAGREGRSGLSPTSKARALTPEPPSPTTKVVASNWV